MKSLADQLRAVDARLAAIDEQIEAWERKSAAARARNELVALMRNLELDLDRRRLRQAVETGACAGSFMNGLPLNPAS